MARSMPKTEADLLELMRADRVVLTKRPVVQTAVDLEAAGESRAARIERVSRRRARGDT
jgi:hypothetical protein